MTGRRALAEDLLRGGRHLDGTSLGTPVESLLTELARATAGRHDVAGQTVAWCGVPASMVVPAVVASWIKDTVPLVVPHGADHLTDHADLVMSRCPDGGFDASWRTGLRAGDEALPTAVLQPTSGSTGRPTVARRSVLSVRAEAARYAAALGLSADHAVVLGVPVTHSYGLGWALSALLLGARVAVPDVLLPHRLTGLVESCGATHLALSAPVAGRLAAVPGATAGSTLRTAMVGAGVVPAELETAFRARFGIGLARNYGSSETGPTFFGDPGLGVGVLGLPGEGVAIVAPPAGTTGELVLALTERGADGVEHTWTHSTGDLVTHGADGSVRHRGRVDGRIRLHGQFTDVSALDDALRAQPGVVDVAFAVLPSRHRVGQEELTVVVAGTDLDERRVRDALEDSWGRSRGPLGLALVPAIPFDDRGKLDGAGVADARARVS